MSNPALRRCCWCRAGLPLAWRRQRPLLAAGATVASFVALYGFKLGPFWASVPFSFLVWLVLIFAGVWMWGRYVQVRRAYTAELEARAERAERDRRPRPAGRSPPSAPGSPASCTTWSPTTSASPWCRPAPPGMPSLLRALRTEDADEARAPQPTLADLDDLVAGVTAAGLPVTLRVQGTRRPLPPSLDLSAYRIVQEALTNSLKHAGPAHAEVVLCYGKDDLEVTVTDDGSASAPGRQIRRSGHGLVGMRERVALFGGELHAGPRPEGGFRVVARLPLEAARP
jgi:histidine kinase/DNA gyrase B/HSP90-like ATPase